MAARCLRFVSRDERDWSEGCIVADLAVLWISLDGQLVVGRLMDLLETIRSAWGFTGLAPRSIVAENPFGNLLVEDVSGRIWRICPEELSCNAVASSPQDLQRLRSTPDFLTDWEMEQLVSLATSALGTPMEGRCFCLKVPAVLGGSYERENLDTILLSELISTAGDMAQQINDLPDGAKVKLTIV